MHRDCTSLNKDVIQCDKCTLTSAALALERATAPAVPDCIRRSYINTYMQCPYKFYMEVVKGIEQPQTIYTQLGIDVHDILDKASCDKSYTHQEMWQDFLKRWETYPNTFFEDAEQKEKMLNRAQNSLQNAQQYLAELGTPFCTEEKIVFSIHPDLPSISTTADRIDEAGDKLHVLDWKTGKPLVGKQHSADIQAPLYIYGIEEHFKRQVERFTFIYLDAETERVFNRINENEFLCQVRKNDYIINIPKTIKKVTNILTRITKGKYNIPNDTQKMYFTCKMCHIREKGMCEGALMQSWRE